MDNLFIFYMKEFILTSICSTYLVITEKFTQNIYDTEEFSLIKNYNTSIKLISKHIDICYFRYTEEEKKHIFNTILQQNKIKHISCLIILLKKLCRKIIEQTVLDIDAINNLKSVDIDNKIKIIYEVLDISIENIFLNFNEEFCVCGICINNLYK